MSDVKRYVVDHDYARAEIGRAVIPDYEDVYVLASDHNAAIAEAMRLIDAWREQAKERDALASRLAEAEREVARLRTEMKAAYHELGGIGTEASLPFHRIGIDSARGILGRALSPRHQSAEGAEGEGT